MLSITKLKLRKREKKTKPVPKSLHHGPIRSWRSLPKGGIVKPKPICWFYQELTPFICHPNIIILQILRNKKYIFNSFNIDRERNPFQLLSVPSHSRFIKKLVNVSINRCAHWNSKRFQKRTWMNPIIFPNINSTSLANVPP